MVIQFLTLILFLDYVIPVHLLKYQEIKKKIEYCQAVVLYNFFVYQHRVSNFISKLAEE